MKNGDLSIVFFFSVHETVGSPTGPDPENWVGDQETGSPGKPVSSEMQCPVSGDIVVQEQDTIGDFTAAFFLQNVLQLHQQK